MEGKKQYRVAPRLKTLHLIQSLDYVPHGYQLFSITDPHCFCSWNISKFNSKRLQIFLTFLQLSYLVTMFLPSCQVLLVYFVSSSLPQKIHISYIRYIFFIFLLVYNVSFLTHHQYDLRYEVYVMQGLAFISLSHFRFLFQYFFIHGLAISFLLGIIM